MKQPKEVITNFVVRFYSEILADILTTERVNEIDSGFMEIIDKINEVESLALIPHQVSDTNGIQD